MIGIIQGFRRGQRSFGGQLCDLFTFLSIGVTCIHREVHEIGCCISLFEYFLHIIRNPMHILLLQVIMDLMMADQWIFCKLRFAFIRLSSGSQLISDDWELQLDSVIQLMMKRGQIEGHTQNLYQKFDLMWIH